jgi:hypothetical protein
MPGVFFVNNFEVNDVSGKRQDRRFAKAIMGIKTDASSSHWRGIESRLMIDIALEKKPNQFKMEGLGDFNSVFVFRFQPFG